MRLLDTLKRINEERRTSFHMPGHQSGRLLFDGVHNLLELDITEIPGADHLHDAKGPILETEKAIAKFYGAERSKMLIGGSTVGILSMILGSTLPGDRILLNRNAHKSIYNAIEMSGLVPVYLYPQIDDHIGIPVGIEPTDVEKVISGVKICVLTYPTYEGLCYPIEEIIECCHRYGVPVLVDEAHGAHLVLDLQGPKSSLALGADLVVQSFHKTLPAMTQTACLHFSENCLLTNHQKERVLWHLSALQTSSPSYVLMASIDHMLTIIDREGVERFTQLRENLNRFYMRINGLKTIKPHFFECMDISKIVLTVPKTFYEKDVWDGSALARTLLEDYCIQAEYDSKTIVLMMTSICTSAEDLNKLADALIEIDSINLNKFDERFEPVDAPHFSRVYQEIEAGQIYVMDARSAVNMAYEEVDVNASVGRISAEYVVPYPPGIPVLVPGERILEETIALFPESQNRLRVIKA